MRRLALIIVVGALAGCGADGPPWRPSANVGLSLGSGGVSPSASLGASNGPVTVGVGF
ncbi:hypothetical protein [Yoonia sp.]|uniref:hypothetical protein n=1 Tax=Yoonia sp. TaxID=2212373 RepID=UPI0019F40D1C|nr:hypothetical protein [Yoonia sp.]MBE0414439.1 hypothetical protein [Yoonia sp.]